MKNKVIKINNKVKTKWNISKYIWLFLFHAINAPFHILFLVSFIIGIICETILLFLDLLTEFSSKFMCTKIKTKNIFSILFLGKRKYDDLDKSLNKVYDRYIRNKKEQ